MARSRSLIQGIDFFIYNIDTVGYTIYDYNDEQCGLNN